MLCCLGLFLSLPATAASYTPSAFVGTQEEDGGGNAPVPDGSYSLMPAEEVQKTDEAPVKAYLLTMLVLAIASFGASVGRLLTTNALSRRGVICSWGLDDRLWVAWADEGPSFLGVFRL
jgi:hypothetical protein